MSEIDIEERNKIFSVLDRYGGQDSNALTQMILDKSKKSVFDEDKITFADGTQDKLRFENSFGTLTYDENHQTTILYDGNLLRTSINEDGGSEIQNNRGVGGCNFLFFHEYNAQPEKMIDVISDVMAYYGIEDKKELADILTNGGVSSATISKILNSQNITQNIADVNNSVLNKMCCEFLSADEDEIQDIMIKVQRSIDPKLLIAELYRNDLIDEDEYYRIIENLYAEDFDETKEFHIFLEPDTMLNLGAIDNVFKLVKDDKVGFKLTGALATGFEDTSVNIEYSYMDLLKKFPQKDIYKKRFTEFLMNTDKSPYEILLTASSDTSDTSKGKGSSAGNNGEEADEDIEEKTTLETQLTDSQRDTFDNALLYVRHKGNPHYYTYVKLLETQQANYENLYKEFNNKPQLTDFEKGARAFIKSKMVELNKYPQSALDERAYKYENAMQHNRRRKMRNTEKLRYNEELRRRYLDRDKLQKAIDITGKTIQESSNYTKKVHASMLEEINQHRPK